LIELYAYELSDVANLKIGSDGRFGYAHLPFYWIDSWRYPYLLWLDDELAGFALIQRGSQVTGAPEVWDMAEFFVLRRHRGRGIGLEAAHEIWSRHHGPWEVRVMQRNTGGLAFWQHAVNTFTGGSNDPELVLVASKTWQVFRLTSS
jgi:predicted acetyltransferase